MSMPKTIAETLSAAADLIEPEGKWTQGAEARIPSGNKTEALDDRAICFCVMGSIRRVSGRADKKGYDTATPAVWYLGSRIGSLIADWNDHPERTQAEVVTELRAAAAQAASEGL